MSRRSPAWLPCPRCQSADTVLVSLRKRPQRIDTVALRGHRCRACTHAWVSIQRAATDQEISDLAARAFVA